MPVTELGGRRIDVDGEGFLTDFDQWDDELAETLAKAIGVDLTDDHWKVIRFLRSDFAERGETPTTRRVQAVGGIPVKRQFELFPKKPGKKMAYIAGLPKPRGCV